MAIKVIQKPNEPEVAKPVLAQSIVAIADSVKRLRSSGLNHAAIVTLVCDDTRLGRKTVEQVLTSLELLQARYTTIRG